MPSRTKRKRHRRRLERAKAKATETPPKIVGGWGQATAGELHLLYHALKNGWQTPPENLQQIVAELTQAVETAPEFDANNERETRLLLARARAIIRAERRLMNLD